jgi:hypothetical protein
MDKRAADVNGESDQPQDEQHYHDRPDQADHANLPP